jgi:hypothetical protein
VADANAVDIRAKATLLTQAEASFVYTLVASCPDYCYQTERAGVLRKLGGLTEPAPRPAAGLHGGLRDRI